MPEFQDRILKCIDCSAGFVFTAGEQQFHHDKEFRNEPKRCKVCKSKRAGSGTASADRISVPNATAPPNRALSFGRVETSAVCSQCGRETTVPFRPTQGRPGFLPSMFPGPQTYECGGRMTIASPSP